MKICITGASGAIGEALVRHYLNDLKHEVVALCNAHSLRAKCPAVDALNYREYTLLGDNIPADEFDLAIMTHGINKDDKIKGHRGDWLNDWRDVVEVNLITTAYLLRKLRVVKGGSVVVIGSIVGSTGAYGASAYSASKAGLVGLVRSAAAEFAPTRVNLLELGYVDAGMGKRLSDDIKSVVMNKIPLRRFAELDDVIGAVEFLRGAYMTGNVLTLAGGMVGHG